MRSINLFIIFIGLQVFSYGQASLPLMTAQKINQIKDPNAFYPLFVEGNMSELFRYIESSGDEISVVKGSFASVKVRKKHIANFISQSFIRRVEDGQVTLQMLMDTALINNNILPIHQAQSPLTKAYTGKNVVVGIIDDGIDETGFTGARSTEECDIADMSCFFLYHMWYNRYF